MPKIELYEKSLLDFCGEKLSREKLEEYLNVAKAELDDVDEDEGILKIELNDTNRPDLWSTAGLGRQLRSYLTGKSSSYDFFSTPDGQRDPGKRIVEVDQNIEKYRPYVAAFAVTGRAIDEPMLKDVIQTQEKLCWNFGRKRKSIAMGVYRSNLITFPVKYRGADPDSTRFVPLQEEREMSLREIVTDHPKGRDFGSIVTDFDLFPYLEDSAGECLSFPPVINSNRLGTVEVGDDKLFIEMTGTDIDSLLLAVSIVACDLSDAGFTILPVRTVYPYDTPYGREIVSPFCFQSELTAGFDSIRKMLGVKLDPEECLRSLERMDISAEIVNAGVTVQVPPYRNDFLHEVDVIEDIMIGHGTNNFEPVMPHEFTPGHLTHEERFARKVKDLMVGLGYQEMIYNYLGSRRDYVERMEIDGSDLVKIANPMSENYELVRNSIMPALLSSESVSAHAVYPHRIFEIGKIARTDADDVTGSVTRNYVGFLASDREMGFNEVTAEVSVLLYYVGASYELVEREDPRFIAGRCAGISVKGVGVGVYGEVHPQVLENWRIGMPCTACEIDLDMLMGRGGSQ